MLSNNSLYAWSASVTSGETVSFGSGVYFFCSVMDVDVVCVLRLVDTVHAERNNVPTHAKILHIFFMSISPPCVKICNHSISYQLSSNLLFFNDQ